jgi:hypothetical protein
MGLYGWQVIAAYSATSKGPGWKMGSKMVCRALRIRDLYEDQRGRIWAATTRGLNLFHPEADPDPPQTRRSNLPGPEKNLAGRWHNFFDFQRTRQVEVHPA